MKYGNRERIMEPFFKDYLSHMQRLRDDALRDLESLPQEALDWVPAPEMNSFCALVVHMTSAERYWIGDVAGGKSLGRTREREFQAQGLKKETLMDMVRSTYDDTFGVLQNLTLEDLAKSRTSHVINREVSVGWALAKALMHTGLHVGHIQIQRQWWEQHQQGR
jgi:uncharacterized damage-inducible protein DinB